MVCFLMGTRLDKEGFEFHCKDIPFKNKLIVKKPNTGGGLALLWKANVQLDVINYTEHHILAKVMEEDGYVWFLTGFYGWAEVSQKQKSWALLSHLSSFVDGPWCCIRDFNAILFSSEKQSTHPPPYKQMEEFGSALDSCNLADLGFHGYPLTWNNKRPGNANTRERLDRAVANTAWREKFPASTVCHLFSHASDHYPILLQTRTDRGVRAKGVRGFKFEEVWLLDEECEGKVNEGWNEKEGAAGSALARVKEKIVKCGEDLLAWGSSKTEPDTEEIKRLQRRVESLSVCEPTEETRAEFLEASKNLDALLRK